MSKKELVTIIVRKPAKQGEDYRFSIPRTLIETKKINPNKTYELRIYSCEV